MSVTTLLSMPQSAGLFAQAITQSGATAHTITAEQGRMVAGYLAESLGVEPTREAIAAVPLDRLVQAASDLVVEVQTAPDPARWGSLAMSLLPFAPVVDGTVLPEHPLEAIASGQSADVRLLVGANRDEARLFLVAAGTLGLIDDPTLELTAGAYGLKPEGLQVYRANRPGASPGDVMAAMVSDWFFVVPGIRVAEARVEHGRNNTWSYRADHLEPADNHGFGSAHATEIPFVFDTAERPDSFPLTGENPSRQKTDALHGAWVAFIKDGDPGWAPYTLEARTTGVFTEVLTAVDTPSAEEISLWEGVR